MASFVLPLSVLFMTILNSELTSTMLITKTTPTVNSYEDILLFKNVKIYTEKNTVLHTMLSEARSELFQRLKPRVAPVEGIFIQTPNTYKLLSAVEQQRGVIVVNVDMAHNLIVTAHRKWHRCPHLQVAREQAGLLLANVFLSRKIPDRTRRKLRKGFRATHEGGFLTKALEWTRRDSSACLSRSDNELKPMTFNQLEGSFMVLAIGGVSSLLSLLIEVAWAKDLHRSCCSSRSGRVLCRALAKANISRLNTLK
ncbi:uncharacterized protein LOC111248570 [Varroa destructor]|uniref:Uncharacterized protein n=1 Tax=Varroa destructor TaxID=109461 RepID=A0A7M7MEX5_VARDE|nr:uncharacterized protein LOC111248570 [Varroa destructor]